MPTPLLNPPPWLRAAAAETSWIHRKAGSADDGLSADGADVTATSPPPSLSASRTVSSGSLEAEGSAMPKRVRTPSAGSLDSRLATAAFFGDEAAMKAALEAGANVNAVDTAHGGMTALSWTASKGAVECCRMLLEYGANTELKNKDEWTALHWAAHGRQPVIVEMLLARGADPSATNRVGRTPASMTENTAIREMLLQNQRGGACPAHAPSGQRPATSVARRTPKAHPPLTCSQALCPALRRRGGFRETLATTF